MTMGRVGVGLGVGVGVGAGAGICLELEPESKISKMGGSGNPGQIKIILNRSAKLG